MYVFYHRILRARVDFYCILRITMSFGCSRKQPGAAPGAAKPENQPDEQYSGVNIYAYLQSFVTMSVFLAVFYHRVLRLKIKMMSFTA